MGATLAMEYSYAVQSSFSEPAASPRNSVEYESPVLCPRSLVSTLVAAFLIFFLFWGQVHALYRSQYYATLASWMIYTPQSRSICGAAFIRKWLKDKIATGLLALLNPFLSFTLSLWTAASASNMERVIIKDIGIQNLEKVNDMGRRWVTQVQNNEQKVQKFLDPRSVRVLIGAQVYLSIPTRPKDGAGSTQTTPSPNYKKITYRYLESTDQISDEPPLEINPTMLLNNEELMSQEKSHANANDGFKSFIIFPIFRQRNNRVSPVGGAVTLEDREECIQLNNVGKQALLRLGYVPPYAYLRQIKYKSGWENILFALNAVGYLMDILSRLLAHQPISPIEGLATFCAFLIVLQTLTQIFLGGSTPLFKQTLLIQLTKNQLKELEKNMNLSSESSTWPGVLTELQPSYKIVLFVALQLVVLATPIIPTSLYTWNHLHGTHNKCSMCAYPAMLFLLNYLVFGVVGALAVLFRGSGGLHPRLCRGGSFTVMLISVVVGGLATFATVEKWRSMLLDKSTAKAWYTYLFPYMS